MKKDDAPVDILADLVAFRTVSGDYDAASACLDYVQDYLAGRGMEISRKEFGGFPSLMATTRRTKRPKLILQAHLDVVSAPEQCFKMIEKNGRLLGRGVFDMKFAAAIFLKIADDLKDALADYDFGIMLTFDEEIGGEDGVRSLLDAGYGAEVCLLPDAGADWKIETSHKGCWIGRASAGGIAAHGSRPWEGDNAIDRLVDALSEMRALFDGQHMDSDTLSVNQIAGGTVANQVADRSEATLDMRFVDDRSFERTHGKMRSIAARHGVTLETRRHIKVSSTDISNPLIVPFIKIAERINGRALEPVRSLGISDAHFFAEKGIPVILSRPEGGASHADGEWIDKEGFEKFYRAVRAYVEEVGIRA